MRKNTYRFSKILIDKKNPNRQGEFLVGKKKPLSFIPFFIDCFLKL